MPVQRCQSGKSKGWKYGDTGKCYTGGSDNDNKRKAYIQGYAIQQSQKREGKSTAGEILKERLLLQRIEAELANNELSPELAAFADELIANEE